jgi:hypothetical protein
MLELHVAANLIHYIPSIPLQSLDYFPAIHPYPLALASL